MIRRLSLENWRSHSRTDFEFGSGTNVIVGKMGAGKSSAMDAMCYALYGTYPSLQQKKLKSDDVIRRGENKASVEITFTKGDSEYSVRRVLERGKGNTYSQISKGDAVIEAPQTRRVTENVEKVLGMGYDMFTRAVYSEQNNLEYFLEIPRGKRKEKIDELLNINKFENARKNLSSLVRRLDERRRGREEAASRSVDTEKIPSIREDIEGRRRLLGGNLQKISALQKGIAENKKTHDEILLQKGLHEKLEKAIDQTLGRLGAMEERMREKPAESEEGLKKTILKLEKEADDVVRLGSVIKSREEAIASYGRKASEIRGLLAEIPGGNISEESADAKKRKDDSNRRIAELKAEINALEKHGRDVEESKAHLLHGGGKCPTCEKPVTALEAAEIIRKKGEEIEGNKKRILEFRAEISELEQNGIALDEALKKLDEKLKAQHQAEAYKKQLEEVLAGIMKENEALGKAKDELRVSNTTGSVEEIRRIAGEKRKLLEYYGSKKGYEEAKLRLEEMRAQLKEVRYDRGHEEKTRQAINGMERDLAVAMKENESLEREIKGKNELLEQLLKLKGAAERDRAEAKYLSESIASFDILLNILGKTQVLIRERFTDETNQALRHFWSRIYPYGDFTDLRLGVEEGDYILQAFNGEWVNIEGISSGGERTTACLCLRIALASVLTGKLSWLVLDEPTHNLDSEAIRDLAQTLKEGFSGLVEQIFIITHEEELREAASAALYMLDRKKEENEPTKII